MDIKLKLLSIFIAFITALFETIGVIGAGRFWSEDNKYVSILVIVVGFGLASLMYVLMRKYVTDLVFAQSIFIASSALLAILFEYATTKPKNEVVVGILIIAFGAIVINKAY